MGNVRARKRNRVRDVKRSSKPKARTKDLDQIADDVLNIKNFENLPIDTDLPGLGNYYIYYQFKRLINI